jgi:diadenosine tetraphosphate (Ap4A) HIT family hydrolase
VSSPETFTLDARLATETHLIGDFELSRVLMMDDARFPWLILVPRHTQARDLVELPRDEQHELLDEINRCSQVLQALFKPDKLNVAALGNVVAQLHVHVVARYKSDAAWPRPIWGVGERELFSTPARSARLAALRTALRIVAP